MARGIENPSLFTIQSMGNAADASIETLATGL
jgi:hypothetical protein